jgi:hypothetical protein
MKRYTRLMAGDLFLDPELPLLEGLNHGCVRYRAAHLVMNLSFDSGMLELQSADVRTIHGRFSSIFGGWAGPHARDLSWRLGMSNPAQNGWNHIRPILRRALMLHIGEARVCCVEQGMENSHPQTAIRE